MSTVQLSSSRRRRAVTADEVDAFSRFRRFLHWRPGERQAVKRRANRRERREGRVEARQGVES